MVDMALVDDRLMPLSEATVSVLDLGFLRGLGAFETLRTYRGHPHALDAHLDRLGASVAALGIPYACDPARVRPRLGEAIAATGYREVRINLIVTPGAHTAGVFGAGHPTEVVILRELHEPPAWWYRDGIAAVTFTGARVVPRHKTTAYITGRDGLAAAARGNAQEALYCDPDGRISEGVTSNVLALRDGTIRTPVDDSLPGITRAQLAPLARDAGLVWEEAPLTRDACCTADELWITSSVRELVPVVRLDDHRIGDGRPGPWAGRLRDAYRATAIATAEREAGR